MGEYKLNSIEDAIKDFKEGKFVIVVDDEDRENEGDLIIAAEKIDADKVTSCSKMQEAYFAHLSPSVDATNSTCLIRYQTTLPCSVLHSP